MAISETGRLIYRNGRHIPTFAGQTHSEESIRKIREALTGQSKSKEQVVKQSPVWEVVRPLFLRGALVREISGITGFTNKQVRNAIHRRRPDWHSVPRELFTKERKRERRRGAAMPGVPKRLSWFIPESQRKNIEFARKLYLTECLVDADLTAWEALGVIYSEKKRKLPEDFAYRLILECFLRASVETTCGDRTDLERFLRTGNSVNKGLFRNGRFSADRRFIMEVVGN